MTQGGLPLRRLLQSAALLTFLSVLMGSVVCATESGFDCPSWPGCYPDRITPIGDINPWIEFAHRSVAVVTGPVLLAAAIVGQRSRSLPRWVTSLLWVALVTAGAAAAFGMVTVLHGLPMPLAVLDIACALTAMTATGIAALAAGRPDPTWRPGRLGRTAWAGVAVIVVMHLAGIAVAGPASLTRCLSWPIWAVLDLDGAAWAQLIRLALAVLGAGLAVVTAAAALRDGGRLRRWGVAVLVLLGVELAMGLVILASGLPADRRYATGAGMAFAAAYAVVAVTLLRALVEIAVRGSVTSTVAVTGPQAGLTGSAGPAAGRRASR